MVPAVNSVISRRGIWLLLTAVSVAWAFPHWGSDAIAYWLPDPVGRYFIGDGYLTGYGAFRYPPPVALVVPVFNALPWPVFLGLWTAFLAVMLYWIVRPSWWLLALPPVTLALALGNVTALFAVVIVAGFRYPVLWSLPLLTKLTPAVGLVWFAVRREWKALGQVALASGVLVILSAVLLPGSWKAWLAAMREQASMSDPTFLPRLGLAVALTAWGALTDRRWVLPVAMVLSFAGIGLSSLVVLLPIVREFHVGERRPALGLVRAPDGDLGEGRPLEREQRRLRPPDTVCI